jgi:hypothetical protein
MAIAPVGGATNTSGAGTVNSFTVTYAPTPGNTVVMFLDTNGTTAALTAKDNLGNNLSIGPGPIIQGSVELQSFYQLSAPSGVTGYTFTWTTAHTAKIVLEEYSGNNLGVNASLAGNTAQGAASPATITCTLDEANDFLVVGIGVQGQTATGTVGSTRQALATELLMDNTAAGGTVTCTATFTNANWIALALELRVSASLFTPPAITSEFHWGGGDGW